MLSKKVKRVLKRVYKDNNRVARETLIKGLVNFFVRNNSFDSRLEVFIFEGNSIETVRRHMREAGVRIDGLDFYSDYSPTGRWFAWPAQFQIAGPNRILVTQRWFHDV